MNSNNGKCPELMYDSRILTNWETSKSYNYKLAQKLNTKTNNEFKEKLISNPENIYYKENYLNCKNEKINYNHNIFVNNILDEMNKDITVRPFYSYEYYNIN